MIIPVKSRCTYITVIVISTTQTIVATLVAFFIINIPILRRNTFILGICNQLWSSFISIRKILHNTFNIISVWNTSSRFVISRAFCIASEPGINNNKIVRIQFAFGTQVSWVNTFFTREMASYFNKKFLVLITFIMRDKLRFLALVLGSTKALDCWEGFMQKPLSRT